MWIWLSSRCRTTIHVTLTLGLVIGSGAGTHASGLNQYSPALESGGPFGTADIVTVNHVVSSAVDKREAAVAFIASRKGAFGLADPRSELLERRAWTDPIGNTHVKLDQMYQGIPVWGCQKIAHFDNTGALYLVAGQTIRTPEIETTPSVSFPAAVQVASTAVGSQVGFGDLEGNPELVIYPEHGKGRLAWKVDVHRPGGPVLHWQVFVDAHTAAVISQYDAICTDGPIAGTGPDFTGTPRSFHAYQQGTTVQMIDATRPMYVPPINDLNGVIVTYSNWVLGGDIVTDPNGDGIFDDTPGLQEGVSGHYWTETSYEYFLNTFGWNSWDNAGIAVKANVHDSAYPNNAYWTSIGVDGLPQMGFSDGDGSLFAPFLDPDIIGHEFTHGITHHSSGLLYQFESGALNESMSDFFGCRINGAGWELGDLTVLEPPGFLRNMQDPHLGYPSNRFPFGTQPAHMSEFVDWPLTKDRGGVHINSGIPNHVGYLVASTIGWPAAEQIWFRCLTTYLTPWSGFNFWAEMLTISAVDLYGMTSPEVDAVAWALDSAGFAKLTVSPTEIKDVIIPLGTIWDTTLSVHSRSSTPVSVLNVALAKGRFTIDSILLGDVALAQPVNFRISLDATGAFNNCDLGLVIDTVLVETSDVNQPLLALPVKAVVGYDHTFTGWDTVQTACRSIVLPKYPGVIAMFDHTILYSGYNPVMPITSFVAATAYGGDTVLYQGYTDGIPDRFWPDANWVATADWQSSTDARGKLVYTMPFRSFDARLGGEVRYILDTAQTDCNYFIAEFDLQNLCPAPITLLTGLHGNSRFDTENTTIDRDLNMITEVNVEPTNDWRDSFALSFQYLGPPARNFRQLWSWDPQVPFVVNPGTIYRHMIRTTDGQPSGFGGDFEMMVTFEQTTLAFQQTRHYRVAIIYSYESLAGAREVATRLITEPVCCSGPRGDVNEDGVLTSADIIYLINWVFKGGTEPACPVAADPDASGNTTSADVIQLVNHVFKGGPAPNPCSLP